MGRRSTEMSMANGIPARPPAVDTAASCASRCAPGSTPALRLPPRSPARYYSPKCRSTTVARSRRCASRAGTHYVRHRPNDTVQCRVVEEHLESFATRQVSRPPRSLRSCTLGFQRYLRRSVSGTNLHNTSTPTTPSPPLTPHATATPPICAIPPIRNGPAAAPMSPTSRHTPGTRRARGAARSRRPGS